MNYCSDESLDAQIDASENRTDSEEKQEEMVEEKAAETMDIEDGVDETEKFNWDAVKICLTMMEVVLWTPFNLVVSSGTSVSSSVSLG